MTQEGRRTPQSDTGRTLWARTSNFTEMVEDARLGMGLHNRAPKT